MCMLDIVQKAEKQNECQKMQHFLWSELVKVPIWTEEPRKMWGSFPDDSEDYYLAS